MPYATASDFYEVFGRDEARKLTDDSDNPTGDLIESKVENALQQAEQKINSYISGKYLPLDTVPPVLKTQTIDLAWAILHKRFPTEASQTMMVSVEKWLNNLASGRVSIGLDATGNKVPSTGLEIEAVNVSKERNSGGTFNDKEMSGFGTKG